MGNPFDQSGQQPSQDDFQDKPAEEFLAEYVGEGKKYANAAELARAFAHGQHHIGTVESENATFRDQLTKAQTVDDIMNKMKEAAAPADGTNTGGDDNPGEPKPEVNIEETFKELLAKHTTEATAQSNKQSVLAKMQATYGSKAGEVWDKAAAENQGVDLEGLAQTSPAAFYKVVGIGAEQHDGKAPSSLNGDVVPPAKDQTQRPPEGSKRLVDFMKGKGEITRAEAYKMKLAFSADPAKYNS